MNAPEIIEAVAEVCGLAPSVVKLKQRHRGVVRARQLAALLMREEGMSYPELSRALGMGNHTSGMCAAKKGAALQVSDRAFSELYERAQVGIAMRDTHRLPYLIDRLRAVLGRP